MTPVQTQIVVMTIIMAVGFLIGKIKLITPEANKYLSNLLLLVVNPCIVFMSYQKEYSKEIAVNLAASFAASVATFAVMILFATLIFPKKRQDYEINRMSVIFSNCSFVGIPVTLSVFGSEGVIYLTTYITVFNVLAWTYGLTLMRKERFSVKGTLKKLCTPMLIAVFLGIVSFFARFTVPEIIGEPMNVLGSMNTPLAMIVAGATLSGAHFRDLIRKPMIFLITFLRLVAAPVIATLICICFIKLGFSADALETVVIAASAPSAVITVSFSHKYGNDSVYASEIFAVTTILSLLSIPLVVSAYEAIITRL